MVLQLNLSQTSYCLVRPAKILAWVRLCLFPKRLFKWLRVFAIWKYVIANLFLGCWHILTTFRTKMKIGVDGEMSSSVLKVLYLHEIWSSRRLRRRIGGREGERESSLPAVTASPSHHGLQPLWVWTHHHRKRLPLRLWLRPQLNSRHNLQLKKR